MTDFKKNYTKEEAKTLVESLRMVVDFARILTKDEVEGRQNLKNDPKLKYVPVVSYA